MLSDDEVQGNDQQNDKPIIGGDIPVGWSPILLSEERQQRLLAFAMSKRLGEMLWAMWISTRPELTEQELIEAHSGNYRFKVNVIMLTQMAVIQVPDIGKGKSLSLAAKYRYDQGKMEPTLIYVFGDDQETEDVEVVVDWLMSHEFYEQLFGS